VPLLCIDDIIITMSSNALLSKLLRQLDDEFTMTDLVDLHFFLIIQATRSASGLFLLQRQYAIDILQ
jgi:hypothetical protein